MKKKLFKKVLTLAVAGAMVVGMTVPAMASATFDDTGSDGSTGSITIYKYDTTSAEADEAAAKEAADAGTGNADYFKYSEYHSNRATGDQITDSNFTSNMSKYAMSGIYFSYLKVGSILQFETTDSGATNGSEIEEELVYSISSDLETILRTYGDLGNPTTTVTTGEGASEVTTDYYTSDQLNTAMSTALAGTGENGYTSYEFEDALYDYITGDSNTTEIGPTNANGMVSATGLDLGLYLIVETKVDAETTTTTDPFFVSIPMTSYSGTGWTYNVYVYPKNETDVELEPEKKVKVVGSTDEKTDALTTATVGDTLQYTVKAELGTITTESTYYTKLEFVDTLSAGMSYTSTSSVYDVKIEFYDGDPDNGGTLRTTWTNGSSNYFTVAVDDTSGQESMTITVTDGITTDPITGEESYDSSKSGLAQINPAYSEYYILITYTVKVSDASKLTYGDEGNTNKVVVTWARTNEEEDSHADEAKVFYYDIDLTKIFNPALNSTDEMTIEVDDGNGGTTEVTTTEAAQAMAAVKFILQTTRYTTVTTYTDGQPDTSTTTDGTTQYIVAELETDENGDKIAGHYYITGYTNVESEATEFTPASDGQLYIDGLAANYDVITYKNDDSGDIDYVTTYGYKYTLTETATYKGYNLLDDSIVIEVTGTEVTKSIDDSTDTVTWTVTENASATIDGEIATWKTSNDGNNYNITILLEINNTQGFQLPLTGGMGTMLVVIIGAVIICLAVVVGNRSKKRKAA